MDPSYYGRMQSSNFRTDQSMTMPMGAAADPRRMRLAPPPPPQISRQPPSSSSYNYGMDSRRMDSSYDPAFPLAPDRETPSFKDFLEKTAPQYDLAPSSSTSFSNSFDRYRFGTGPASNYINNNNNGGSSSSHLMGSVQSASADDFLSTTRRNAENTFDNRGTDVNNFSRRAEIQGDDYYRRPSANATTAQSSSITSREEIPQLFPNKQNTKSSSSAFSSFDIDRYLENRRRTSIEKERNLQTTTTTVSSPTLRDFDVAMEWKRQSEKEEEMRRRRIQVDSSSMQRREGVENISNINNNNSNNKSLIDEIPEDGQFIEANVAIFRRKVTHIDGEIGFAGTDLFFHMSKVMGTARPQVGSTVIIKAEKVEKMPFKWNALSVDVVTLQYNQNQNQNNNSAVGSRQDPYRNLSSHPSSTSFNTTTNTSSASIEHRLRKELQEEASALDTIPLYIPHSQSSSSSAYSQAPIKSILKNKPAPPPPQISSEPTRGREQQQIQSQGHPPNSSHYSSSSSSAQKNIDYSFGSSNYTSAMTTRAPPRSETPEIIFEAVISSPREKRINDGRSSSGSRRRRSRSRSPRPLMTINTENRKRSRSPVYRRSSRSPDRHRDRDPNRIGRRSPERQRRVSSRSPPPTRKRLRSSRSKSKSRSPGRRRNRRSISPLPSSRPRSKSPERGRRRSISPRNRTSRSHRSNSRSRLSRSPRRHPSDSFERKRSRSRSLSRGRRDPNSNTLSSLLLSNPLANSNKMSVSLSAGGGLTKTINNNNINMMQEKEKDKRPQIKPVTFTWTKTLTGDSSTTTTTAKKKNVGAKTSKEQEPAYKLADKNLPQKPMTELEKITAIKEKVRKDKEKLMADLRAKGTLTTQNMAVLPNPLFSARNNNINNNNNNNKTPILPTPVPAAPTTLPHTSSYPQSNNYPPPVVYPNIPYASAGNYSQQPQQPYYSAPPPMVHQQQQQYPNNSMYSTPVPIVPQQQMYPVPRVMNQQQFQQPTGTPYYQAPLLPCPGPRPFPAPTAAAPPTRVYRSNVIPSGNKVKPRKASPSLLSGTSRSNNIVVVERGPEINTDPSKNPPVLLKNPLHKENKNKSNDLKPPGVEDEDDEAIKIISTKIIKNNNNNKNNANVQVNNSKNNDDDNIGLDSSSTADSIELCPPGTEMDKSGVPSAESTAEKKKNKNRTRNQRRKLAKKQQIVESVEKNPNAKPSSSSGTKTVNNDNLYTTISDDDDDDEIAIISVKPAADLFGSEDSVAISKKVVETKKQSSSETTKTTINNNGQIVKTIVNDEVIKSWEKERQNLKEKDKTVDNFSKSNASSSSSTPQITRHNNFSPQSKKLISRSSSSPKHQIHNPPQRLSYKTLSTKLTNAQKLKLIDNEIASSSPSAGGNILIVETNRAGVRQVIQKNQVPSVLIRTNVLDPDVSPNPHSSGNKLPPLSSKLTKARIEEEQRRRLRRNSPPPLMPHESPAFHEPVIRISRRRSLSPPRHAGHRGRDHHEIDPMRDLAVKQLEIQSLELRDREIYNEMQRLRVQRERFDFNAESYGDPRRTDNHHPHHNFPHPSPIPTCYICMVKGHRARECEERIPEWLMRRVRVPEGFIVERNHQGVPEPFCLCCGRIGHFTRDCRERNEYEVYSDDEMPRGYY